MSVQDVTTAHLERIAAAIKTLELTEEDKPILSALDDCVRHFAWLLRHPSRSRISMLYDATETFQDYWIDRIANKKGNNQ